ncbi:MAG: hypothetical protein RLZZ328_1221, partial [Bacteroidota bacterium]
MAEVILMPRLSDTMTEGVIAAWHKNVGDTVKKGDLLAEIETDKATMELESYQDGVLLHIGTPRGGKLQVNDLLAIFGKQGEDISALIAQNSGGAAPASVAQTAPATTTPAPAAPAANAMDVSAMEEVVLMPRLSDTMTEGVIAGWHKKVGDTVKKGEVLADIETDKATMELESYKDGILLYQGAKAGEKIIVNELLCIIGKDGLDVNAIVAAVKGGANAAPAASTTASTAPAAAPAQASAPAAPAITAVVNDGRIFASPLAKKIAQERGIDLKYVKGTGDNGRITRADLDNYTPGSATPAASTSSTSTAPTFVPSGTVSFVDTPVSQMRKVIAKRLSESLFTAPH